MDTKTTEFNYSDLGLKVDNSYKTIEWNGHPIEIFEYLPIEYKYNLIMVTLLESKEDGCYNPIKLDMFFHTNIVLSYTRNITFTQEQESDKATLYNEFMTSGLLDCILDNIDEDEYNNLFDYLQNTKNELSMYNRSAGAIITSFINDLPKNAEKAMGIIKDFNPDQMKELVNLANSLGVAPGVTNKLTEIAKRNS